MERGKKKVKKKKSEVMGDWGFTFFEKAKIRACGEKKAGGCLWEVCKVKNGIEIRQVGEVTSFSFMYNY